MAVRHDRSGSSPARGTSSPAHDGPPPRGTRGGAVPRVLRLARLLAVPLVGTLAVASAVLAAPDRAAPAAPVAPIPRLAAGGVCMSVEDRDAREHRDCAQVVRSGLVEGRLALAHAVSILEDCAANRPEYAFALERREALRLERYRARLAFGETLETAEAEDYEALSRAAGPNERTTSPAAVRRLQAAGISPAGFGDEEGMPVVDRLRESAELRRAFREVFGDRTADDLDWVLDEAEERHPRAFVLGNTVVVGALAPTLAARRAEPAAPAPAPTKRVRVLTLEGYGEEVALELEALETARLRYLESAARSHHLTGSARNFLSSLRQFGAPTEQWTAADLRAANDHAVLLARLSDLQRELGVEPLVYQTAVESVAFASEIEDACGEVALRRRQWIHTGAGGVTFLVGAAGIVVASGATGTLAGGLTIAAALEATLGAYLLVATERSGEGDGREARRRWELPGALEERRFDRPDRYADVGDGRDGDGQGVWELLMAQGDEDSEWGEGEGEAGEEEGAEERPEPRENTVAAVLPPVLPEELTELPPMLDPSEMEALRNLTLADIQERLDEFLALDSPAQRTRNEQFMQPRTAEQLIEEARAALRLWRDRRELSAGFGEFFLHAELEEIGERRRPEVLTRAHERFSRDQAVYRQSRDLETLRDRIAERLVTHCRYGGVPGDLVLTACTDGTALTILVVAAIREAGLAVPSGATLGVQTIGQRFQPVLFHDSTREVVSLMTGERTARVLGPIYHPASFYYSYLLEHGVEPDIDPERHLLITLADPDAPQEDPCVEEPRRGILQRAVGWLRSTVGIRPPSRRGAACAVAVMDPTSAQGEKGEASSDGGSGSEGAGSTNRDRSGGGVEERSGTDISINLPRIPRPSIGGGRSGGSGQGSGGGGQSGGGRPGGQSGGTQSGGQSGGQAGGAAGGGGTADGGGAAAGTPAGASGSSGGGERSGGGGGEGGAGAGSGGGQEETGAGGGAAAEGARQGGGQGGAGRQGGTAGGAGGGEGDGGSSGTAMAGGRGQAGDSDDSAGGGMGGTGAESGLGPDLGEVARETVAMARRADAQARLRIQAWRLRPDQGMLAGPSGRVLFADNERALSRFEAEDRFITLTPADVEGQRRMLEANSHPILAAGTGCDAGNLPPRRVFREAADAAPGYRYTFCDQDETMVIFRTRAEAQSYADMKAPDRPLYLARLASEKLDRVARSAEVAKIRAFLEDPEVLRGYSSEEVDSIVKTAGALMTFQAQLESALVESMKEIDGSGVRSYYYDLHRQVFQGPFFLEFTEAVYRLNRRLASDPLQSLAWANALPPETRQHFFRLYHVLGGAMYWPDRWELLQERYGATRPERRAAQAQPVTLDFLQILSDPTRVQVDWRAGERVSQPSIRDRRIQQGKERSPEERRNPTQSELHDKQDAEVDRRGGTRGLGRAGEGESIGPERGKRPLQIINIRVAPDSGDPDRHKLPDDNKTLPGGTKGREKKEEETASRQEPMLWVSPETFVEAVLSTWDRRGLEPESAGRVPPLIRFNQRLRELFLRDIRKSEVHDARLLSAMSVFTAGGWLRYEEVRDAMGGQWVQARAYDTGRFSAAYSGNAPINDQDQIRLPNFFAASGVVIPADLFDPLRTHYTEKIYGIFDLARDLRVQAPVPLRAQPLGRVENAEQARINLLRSLELVRQQARSNE